MDTVSGTLAALHTLSDVEASQERPARLRRDLLCAADVLGIAGCGLGSLALLPGGPATQIHAVLATGTVLAGAVPGGLLLRGGPAAGGAGQRLTSAALRGLGMMALLGAIGLADGIEMGVATPYLAPWAEAWMGLSFALVMALRAGMLAWPERAAPADAARREAVRGGLLKDAIDRTLAGLALLMLSPLLLAVAIAVRLDSPGPALFRQEREGLHGRRFLVLKFRSMRVDANAAGTLRQTERGDSRCTALGHFLRRTSLDELPQLLNVLRGDMSLVGPRPHALTMRTEGRACHELVANYALRHRMKPGLTGWAQVNGARGATGTAAELRRRVELDLRYIERWSFWLDLRIMALTAVRLLRDEGAF